jgi:anti-anti-sigma regulatory factor
MSVVVNKDETRWVVRLEGCIDINCTTGLRRILVEALSSRRELQVDLVHTRYLDVTAVQLLWAAREEARKTGTSWVPAGEVPEDIGSLVRDAGFEGFLLPFQTRMAAVACSASAAGPARSWHLRFCPNADLLQSGTNPLLLFRELRQLGSVHIKADTSGIPAVATLDPQRCYLTWDMVLTTSATRDEIRDIFTFVEDRCELVIEPASAPPQGRVHHRDFLFRPVPLTERLWLGNQALATSQLRLRRCRIEQPVTLGSHRLGLLALEVES